MKANIYRKISILISMLIGGLVGFAVSIGNPLLAGCAVPAGMAVLYLCKKKLEVVVEDERTYRIAQRASFTTLQLVALCFAIVGALLIAMRNLYPAYADLGFFLSYASCGILVLYALFYSYFSKKYGA